MIRIIITNVAKIGTISTGAIMKKKNILTGYHRIYLYNNLMYAYIE